MKGYSGFKKNKPEIERYALAIGKYLVNFGAIELLTYYLIEALADDPVLIEVSQEMMFSKRLELLKKLLYARNIQGELKSDFDKSLDCAKQLGEFRNKIAHNPLVFSSSSCESGENSHYIGIPLVKKSFGQLIVTVVDIKPIESGIDAVVELAENFDELLSKVK